MTGSATQVTASLARRWVWREEPSTVAVAELEAALHLPQPLCRLLLLRGYEGAEAARRFLKPRLDQLPDPFLLTDMDLAVARIRAAIEKRERILVHGDYDVDGICSAALFTRVLRRLGATVEAFVPHRMHDGYDLSHAGVRRALEVEATLIVTGDCGIVAHDAVREAQAAGVDVIVTDHHTPGVDLPPAVAVINPNRTDCRYPEKSLAGVGVAFKLCQALQRSLGRPEAELFWHLDLVALATIADLAPLTGENRVLVHFGLRVLRDTRMPGLAALMRTADVARDEPIPAGQVSHVLAPRINAVGRMGAAARGVDLLLADEDGVAAALAEALEAENRTRQAVDRDILRQALDMVEQTYDPERDYALVLAATGWHPGVIGIVASRVVEHVHRPVILIAIDAETGRGRGSARSIPAFHLYDAVHACAHLLERYGGHRQAAGLEIRADRIAALRAAFNQVARDTLGPDDLVPEIRIDIGISLAAANTGLVQLIRHFGPFGIGNPTPVFAARAVRVVGAKEVGDGQHVRMQLEQDGARLAAIGFRLAQRVREIDVERTPLDVVFQLQEDRWNGRTRLQARLLDVRPSA